MQLSLHLMPPMWREFQVRISPQQMLADPAYAQRMADLASTSHEPRLVRYAEQLRELLQADAVAPVAQAAVRAPAPAPAAAPPQDPEPARRYVKSLR
jgi:hypothetical protein